MSVKTPEQFFDLLVKSTVLDEARLAKAKQATEGMGNVKDVARQLVKSELLTKWQAAKLLSGKSNLVIGKYRLLGQIGGASTGTVFLAEHAQMHRRVALKALLHRDHSPESTQKFLKQARAVSSLEHPHLTRAYDIDIQDQYYYLVLEYVEGRSVARILEEQGKFDPHDAARYIRQAADALAYAHDKGLLHRDVRPANLMVTNEGDLKVLNLGVVKLSDPAEPPADDSTDKIAIDHALYLSPEQARGSDNIDPRSDIYSLGCVMFAMLTGETPFNGRTYGEVVKKHQSAAPKKILDLNPSLSRDLAKICLKMLGKKREERFQSAAQIVTFLDKWLAANALPAAAKPPVAAPAVAMEPLKSPEDAKPPRNAASSNEPVIGLPDENPVPAIPGAIAIKAGPKRGTRKKKSSGRAAPAEVAPDGEAPASSKKALIIGGGIGGGVLALAAVVLIVVFAFSGSDEPQVAQNSEQPPAVPSGKDLAEAEAALNGSNSEPAPAIGEEPAPEVPSPDAAPTAEPATDEPPATDAAAGLLAALGNSSTTEEPPSDDEAPAESPPGEAAPEQGPPAEAPAAAAAAEPPAGNDAAEPAPAPRRTPAQEKEPLKELLTMVNLPPLERSRGAEATEPPTSTVSLGKVFDPIDEAVFVDLLGADQVARGSVGFEIEREVASAVDNRKWTIMLTSERQGGEKRPVAEIDIVDFNFNFRWLAAAAEAPNDANSLRNCMFLVMIGKEEKAVALRTPQAIEPISVNLSGRISRTTSDIDNMPKKEELKIEITRVEGFPQKTSLPPGPFSADAGTATIGLGDPGQPLVEFELKANVSGRRPAIAVAPRFQVSGMAGKLPYSPANLNQVYSGLIQQQNAANEFLRKRDAPQQQKALAEKAIADANAAIPQLSSIKEWEQAMAESGKIHYRVLYTVGTRDMVIASSEAQ